jgi:hypothetical protein
MSARCPEAPPCRRTDDGARRCPTADASVVVVQGDRAIIGVIGTSRPWIVLSRRVSGVPPVVWRQSPRGPPRPLYRARGSVRRIDRIRVTMTVRVDTWRDARSSSAPGGTAAEPTPLLDGSSSRASTPAVVRLRRFPRP